MSFPPHIAAVLDRYGVKAETKAALYDLYASLGSDVLEVFAELADQIDVTQIEADAVTPIRTQVIERYVRKNHPRWGNGVSTPSLWHPRSLEGRVSGLLTPMGVLSDDPTTEFADSVASVVRLTVGENQPVPNGLLMLGKNAHYGGRFETVSFDVVALELEEAVAAALAAGQQHTVPGSVGETSGTVDMIEKRLLIWEIQPNVLKPGHGRNGEVSKLWRRHRNWHVTTLTMAVLWGMKLGLTTYILRGDYLSTAHEVNAAKPVGPDIVALHDRTVAAVASTLGARLEMPMSDEVKALRESELTNHALSTLVENEGAASAFWRFELDAGREH
jgi:hypothetical protein